MKGLPKVLFVDDQSEVLEDLKVSVSDVCDAYSETACSLSFTSSVPTKLFNT